MQYYKSHYNSIFFLCPFQLIKRNGELGFAPYERRKKFQIAMGDPVLQSISYDPFENLQSAKQNKRIIPPYIEFSNLDLDNPEALLHYANTRGIPLSPPATSEFFDAFSDDIRDEFSYCQPAFYPLKDFQKEIRRMRAALDFKRIVEGDSSQEWLPKLVSLYKDADIKTAMPLPIDFSLFEGLNKHKKAFERKSQRINAAHAFEEIITEELYGMWPVVKIHRRYESIEKLYIYKNLKQTLYATLYEDLSLPVSSCANEKCGEYFTVDHKGKIYCSPCCATKVARRKHYWKMERPKRLAQTKGGSHGKTKLKG